MILRLSQKLATKIKAGKLVEAPPDENPYADWSCHLFVADRTQYILVTNTASLYSCLLYGRGISDDHYLIVRVLDALREFMEDDGQQFVYQRLVAPSSATITFEKSLNRSVIGSINDFVQATKCLLRDDLAPSEIGHFLNDMPMSALRVDGRKYGKPKEVFKGLVGRI